MTGQEFIESLSPIAHGIISKYHFKEEKPIALYITDNVENPCYMVNNNPVCYPICINPEALGPMAEKQFIHQFCHCVQLEDQFPYVFSKTPDNPETVELAEAINSLVLDMYVNHVLTDNGYPKDIKQLENLYMELHFRFRYFEEHKMPITSYDKKYAEYIYAAQIAKIYMELDSKRARTLQKEVSVFSQNTKLYAGIFINVIQAYPYDTHVGCHYIFDHLLEQLNLTDILDTDHRMDVETEMAPEDQPTDNVIPLKRKENRDN